MNLMLTFEDQRWN